MNTKLMMAALLVFFQIGCTNLGTTPTLAIQHAVSTYTPSPTAPPTKTSTYTITPAYTISETTFKVTFYQKPSDLPSGTYLLYEAVGGEDSPAQARFFYTNLDGTQNNPLLDIGYPEHGDYQFSTAFPNSYELQTDLKFEYYLGDGDNSGYLFINLESGLVRQVSVNCKTAKFGLPNVITSYVVFVCDDSIHIISTLTWDILSMQFPMSSSLGFHIEWVSPNLVWFGRDDWLQRYSYCVLRLNDLKLSCYQDLPYRINLLSTAGPEGSIEVYYEDDEGGQSGVALFPASCLEDPYMSVCVPEYIATDANLFWLPSAAKYFTITSEYPADLVAKYWIYDLEQQETELGSIPAYLVPRMLDGFWGPDGLHYILKFEVPYGNEFIQEVWQISVVTGEMEQLAPGIHNIRDVIGYFQVP